jgi:hypothetical protein
MIVTKDEIMANTNAYKVEQSSVQHLQNIDHERTWK